MSFQMERSDQESGSLMIEQFCQWPLVLWAGIWSSWAELMWPRPTLPAPPPHLSEHEQLIVPEPIEETGECSLFA